MREIKFRAWDKIDEILITDICSIDYDQESLLVRYDDDLYWLEFKDCTLVQYTGLKDKNGVEIYCSDIIDTKYYGIKKVGDTLMECALYGFYNGNSSDYEVIGNIYEAPELLND